MNTIRWIVSLFDKKIQGLVAVFLIGLGITLYTIKSIHTQAEQDRMECMKQTAILNKTIEVLKDDQIKSEIKHKEEILLIKDKANNEVKAQLQKSEEKVDRMENIIMNTVRAAKNVKSTEKSQERVINHLKINNNE